jgi:hypothetical protein
VDGADARSGQKAEREEGKSEEIARTVELGVTLCPLGLSV